MDTDQHTGCFMLPTPNRLRPSTPFIVFAVLARHAVFLAFFDRRVQHGNVRVQIFIAPASEVDQLEYLSETDRGNHTILRDLCSRVAALL